MSVAKVKRRWFDISLPRSQVSVNNAVVATISVGPFPTNIDVNPTGTLLYVTNGSFPVGNVSVIDTASNTLVANVSVTGFPLFLGRFIADPQLGKSITTEVPTMSTLGILLLAVLLIVICAYRFEDRRIR